MPDLYERGCGEQEDGYTHQHTKRCFVKVDEPLYRMNKTPMTNDGSLYVMQGGTYVGHLVRVNGAGKP